MSLTKLLMAPLKLFKKEVITFLIIRRYDLGVINENLQYISVKPSASVSILRHKIWHLLELPDYCEEIIILKSPSNVEIALTELRRGNDPQHPYILEVWLPENKDSTTILKNMITYNNEGRSTTNSTFDVHEKEYPEKLDINSQTSFTAEKTALNKLQVPTVRDCNMICTDFKKSNLSCKFSRSSIFRLNGRKSQDNFTNLLLKIQNDLSTLTNKLTILENKISTSYYVLYFIFH